MDILGADRTRKHCAGIPSVGLPVVISRSGANERIRFCFA